MNFSNMKNGAIEVFVKAILDADAWHELIKAITMADTTAATNGEKHIRVRQAILRFGEDISIHLLDAIVKLGVVWLRAQSEK
jgi:hypothetical protein